MLKLLLLLFGTIFIYSIGHSIGLASFLEVLSSLAMFFYGSGLIGFANIGNKLFR